MPRKAARGKKKTSSRRGNSARSTKLKQLRNRLAKRSKTKGSSKAKGRGAKRSSKKATAKKRSTKISHLPKGYQSVIPYLIVSDGNAAIEFYKATFGAKLDKRMEHKGKIGHAELVIGDAKFMLADEYPEMDTFSPEKFGGSPVSIHVYVKNVDEVLNKGLQRGGKILRPAENMFYGDRTGTLEDPYGHKWYIATHIENVSLAEMKKRAAKLFDKDTTEKSSYLENVEV